MKKLLSILTLSTFLFGGGLALAYTEPTDPGVKVNSPEGKHKSYNVYRLVRNPQRHDSAASFASGDVVLWDTVSDDAVTVNDVSRLGLTTSSDFVAGVVVGSIPTAEGASTVAGDDINRRNWGYIQTYGKALASLDGTVIAVGEGLRASVWNRAGTAVDATADSGATLGFAFDANSSTTRS